MIPVKIYDEHRYLSHWELKIEDKSSGKVMRTIQETYERASTIASLDSLKRAILYADRNVAVPEAIVWDGKDESGVVVPDGPYFVSLTARDDNGIENTTYQDYFIIVVDTKKPQAYASVAPNTPMVFSPDGDGRRDSMLFRNSGSSERAWKVEVVDQAGTVVSSKTWERQAPTDYSWDGTTNEGKRVPDGFYTLRLSAEDEAGNKAVSSVEKIEVDTSRPAVSIAADESVISPNGDGAKDGLNIIPSIESFEGLTAWEIYIWDENRTKRWSASGDANNWPKKSYYFQGQDSAGRPLPDGQYEAGIWMEFRNGYKPEKFSAPFYMDRNPPTARIAAGDPVRVFSPDGDDNRDSYEFVMESSEEDSWILIIRDVAQIKRVERRFAQQLPESFVWNGKDDQGKAVPDGEYELFISSTDRAGNSFSASSPRVRVDTRKPELKLSSDLDAFSPNGDGIAERVRFMPELKDTEGMVGWRFSIQSIGQENGARTAPVYIEGKDKAGLESLYWFDGLDGAGRMLPDGNYKATLEVDYRHGYRARVESESVLLDRTYPKASVRADKAIFNPAGNPDQNKVVFTQSGTAEESWSARIKNSSGVTVKRWNLTGEPSTIIWDGTADSGLPAPDGMYQYQISSTDKAGNSFVSAEIPIEVDSLKKEIWLSVASLAFSPNGDGIRDSLEFSADATASQRLGSWSLSIFKSGASDKVPVRRWTGSRSLQKSFSWDGMADSGIAAPDGQYEARLEISYPNGDKTEAGIGPFLMDRIPPKATVRVRDSLFSPNGDGILDTARISQSGSSGDQWKGSLSTQSGEVLRTWAWADQPSDIDWDGRDQYGAPVPDGTYYYELVSADTAGNSYSSGRLPIGVETEKKALRLDIDQRAFSPNGDGVRDELVLGAAIQAPDRVKDYELRIVAQDGPAALSAVRTWKGSGAIGARTVWRGETDSGIAAPDGRYAASLTMRYTNGDELEAFTPTFLLDRVFPSVELSANATIFSPNGDGRSDDLRIRQSSKPGDDWKGTITASDGTIVKTLAWKNQLADYVWDGKDDTGSLVRDGLYRYVVESTDQAGNRTSSRPIDFMVESEKKLVRMDADTLAFSPNGDGVKDRILLGVKAQYPERIRSYELVILQDGSGASQLPVRSWKGTKDIGSQYYWDGLTDAGISAPDGQYIAKLAVLYQNDDYHQIDVGPFVVDRVAPRASVKLSSPIFSPNGDGRLDKVDIIQEAMPGDVWQGQIVSSSNRIVRSWTWNDKVESLSWDGRNLEGTIVPDGMYFYELRSIDLAGNSFLSPRLQIEVDAAKKAVKLEVDQRAFSPNGDGVKDRLYINIQAPKVQTLEAWDLGVYSLDGTGRQGDSAVRLWKGQGDLKDQYAWDGRTDSGIQTPDGKYIVSLNLRYANGDSFSLKSGEVLLDTVVPTITVDAAPLLFSPNGDGMRDSIYFNQRSSLGDDWTGRIKNASGAVVRSYTWKGEAKPFSWDGKDSNGSLVKDGQYSYEVGSTDAAGNSALAKIVGIVVDATKPRVFVTASDTGMSPNGDGIRDEVSFTIVVENREGIQSWRFALVDKQGTEKSYFGGSGSEVPARLVWDGRDLQGQVVQGEFIGKLVVNYTKGDVAQASSSAVLVDVDPPVVDLTVDPEYFSPDGDGDSDILTFGIGVDAAAGIVDWKLQIFETAILESSGPEKNGNDRLFMEWSGKGKPPATITWNGLSMNKELVESATDYPFIFTARDGLGNSTKVSGYIAVDVLVIRDGNRLKIKVPSIVFRANFADFAGLAPDIMARNERVVARIAQILNKFPDYKIRIEGHANNVGKMLGYPEARIQAEELKELIPLSTGRAELVRTMLVQNGVDSRRLSVEGLGSSEPVVSFLDVVNRWKNRRVEFVLIKNQ
ncbi:MAG TPA: FlgD immunoglobulin-like domain containing protein [Rectinemataceae bacterium]